MIDELQVENLALISKATLVPARGLTVLTGETGAGKTALLVALKLLMGARSDKESIREGADALQVSGRFYLSDTATSFDTPDTDASSDVCDDAVAGTTPDTSTPPFDSTSACGCDLLAAPRVKEVVVNRRVGTDGRSRISIEGRMASVRELSENIAPSIDLCGQHEHQQLLTPRMHVHLLDAWAAFSIHSVLSAYEKAFEAAQVADSEYQRVCEAKDASSAQLDEARFVLQRIERVNPFEGEYEALREEVRRAEHVEALSLAAHGSYEALAGEGGAIDRLGSAISALEGGSPYDATLGSYAEALRETRYVLEDIARETCTYRDRVAFEPEALAAAQERMAQLQGLLHAYGPGMEEVLDRKKKAADLLRATDDAEECKRIAKQACERAQAVLLKEAAALTQARLKEAPRFAQAVTEQMKRLEMGGASLECVLVDLDQHRWTKAGPHTVEFMFSPGKGMQPRPLARIASGGEISRVMLALKVVLGKVDKVDTLVFDEVDAGVGGSVAVALAQVLADLAQTHQVLVVTHLPQVAVRAQVHYVVRKQEGTPDALPQTEVALLCEKERVSEIARMLSGDETPTSLAHAREMLKGGSGVGYMVNDAKHILG